MPTSYNEEALRPFHGQRLDVFLASILERSRSHSQALLKDGLVILHPHPERIRPSYCLREGDSIILHEAPPDPNAQVGGPQGEDIPLEILYEDEALLAINKQPGLVVHPAVGHHTGTLVNALVHHLGSDLATRGGDERSGLVHRLDKDTSGIILVAKTDIVHEKPAAAFAERHVKKIYRALCWGVFRRNTGEMRGPIGRHPVYRQKMAVVKNPEKGRDAWTDYKVLAQGKYGAEVECLLHTGRTHQIRVHLTALGHPIWGDLIYGKSHPLGDGFHPERQMLHAALLEIEHPLTGKMLHFEAPVPEDYATSRARLVEK